MNITRKLAKIGVFKDKNGNTRLSPTAFAKYIKRRYKIIYTPTRKFYIYQNGVYKDITEDEMKSMLYKEIESVGAICLWYINVEEAYVAAIKRITYYKRKLNTYKYLINTKNGMLDIRTMKLKPHSSKYYSTVQLPIEYNQKAKCPQFKKFLKEIFLNNKKTMKFVQEMMGYILINSAKAHRFFVFYGIGSNGKSVLANIIICMVGEDNCSAISIRDLTSNFSRAVLNEKMLNISTENESPKGTLLDSQYIKAVSSGESINAEEKYKPTFTFKPTCKMIFCTNKLPQFNDISEGLFRRITIVPFDAQFSIKDGTADVHLEAKLKDEITGIFNFALKGLNRLVKNGFIFTESKKMEILKKQYEKLVNPYDAFWSDCITTKNRNENLFENTKADFYSVFIKWCADNNHKHYANITPEKFWMDFKGVMIRKTKEKLKFKKSGSERYVTNLFIKDEYCYRKPKKITRVKPVLDDSYNESFSSQEDDEI